MSIYNPFSKFSVITTLLLCTFASYGFIGSSGTDVELVDLSLPNRPLKSAEANRPLRPCGGPSIVSGLRHCRAVHAQNSFFQLEPNRSLNDQTIWRLVRRTRKENIWILKHDQSWKMWAWIKTARKLSFKDSIKVCAIYNHHLKFSGIHFHLPDRKQLDQAAALGLMYLNPSPEYSFSNVIEGENEVWTFSHLHNRWITSQIDSSISTGVFCVSNIGQSSRDKYDQTLLVKKTDLEFEMASDAFLRLEHGMKTDSHFLR